MLDVPPCRASPLPSQGLAQATINLGRFLREAELLPTAGIQAELKTFFLSTLLPYFESPQAVLSFPLAVAAYLAGLQQCVGVEATWGPIQRLLVAVSAALDSARVHEGRQRQPGSCTQFNTAKY